MISVGEKERREQEAREERERERERERCFFLLLFRRERRVSDVLSAKNSLPSKETFAFIFLSHPFLLPPFSPSYPSRLPFKSEQRRPKEIALSSCGVARARRARNKRKRAKNPSSPFNPRRASIRASSSFAASLSFLSTCSFSFFLLVKPPARRRRLPPPSLLSLNPFPLLLPPR